MVEPPDPISFMENFRDELQTSVLRFCPLEEACQQCRVSVAGLLNPEDTTDLEVLPSIRRVAGCELELQVFEQLCHEAGQRTIALSGIDADFESN